MKKTKINRFEFHFIMDERMRNKLLNLTLHKKTGNFSRMIVKILLLLYPRLEREHLLLQQRFSRYELINTKQIESNVPVK